MFERFNVRPWPGRPITEPGIYSDVPMDVYHGANLCDGPSISSSGLRTIFLKSAAHYWMDSPYNPKRREPKEKEAYVLGRAAHHIVLGQAEFSRYYRIRPEVLNGKPWHASRNDCKDWLADNAGFTILSPDIARRVKGIAEALLDFPLVQKGVLNGLVEHTVVWRDQETGIWCKIRPDAIPNDGGDATDLKTTVSCQRDDLQRSFGEYGYNQQAAFILEGLSLALGLESGDFGFLFAESEMPHIVKFRTVAPEEIKAGHTENHAALRHFKACLGTNLWPDYDLGRSDGGYLVRKPWDVTTAERRVHELAFASESQAA